jgi:hypothetical protein
MEEVIRPCGLLHHGLRTPTLSNTHWSLLACPLFRSLYGQINSGVSTRFFIQWAHTTGPLSPFSPRRICPAICREEV